jgi:hypothetical protein
VVAVETCERLSLLATVVDAVAPFVFPGMTLGSGGLGARGTTLFVAVAATGSAAAFLFDAVDVLLVFAAFLGGSLALIKLSPLRFPVVVLGGLMVVLSVDL